MATQTETEVPRTSAPDLSFNAFAITDWGLLAGTALMWGSSFIFIEEGLEAFSPALITVLRLAFGVLALAAFSKARAPVQRADLSRIALLAVFWMAAPFLLFPIAQQWIDSSLAGMLNGAVPIFASLVAAVAIRRLPGWKQGLGIAIGFAGVVVVSLPAVDNAKTTAVGIFLVLLATLFYGIALNLAVPLQHKYGSLPVLLRAQLFALLFVIIPGCIALTDSSFKLSSLASMVPLGALGTGLAFVFMATLIGRVGAARGSVTIYFVPCVAVALGAIVRGEHIEVVSLLGAGMVIAGAYLASRRAAGH